MHVKAEDDPKVLALVEAQIGIAEQATEEGIGAEDTRDKRKVLIFTYFADTAHYLRDSLEESLRSERRLAPYRDRMVLVTGSDSSSKEDAIVGFAPRTAGTEKDTDRYDLAVATDVLSEGVNLQQARHIINYDLPWNPMRLVQRHGRIDRIGSKHRYIYLHCFFPDRGLEKLLQLEERLQRKLKQAVAAFGQSEVLPGVVAVDRVLAETREEIERLRREDASLFSDTGSASASSEEFQRRLAEVFESAGARRSILDLPWGAGSGMAREGAQTGIVFCARVADHPRPAFRFVVLDDTLAVGIVDGLPDVSGDLLTCLHQADPQRSDVPPDLPDALREAAFDAWAVARDSIHRDWMRRTDPATFEPRVPRVMREAADLVRRKGGVLGDAQDLLVRRLNQDVDVSIQRQIRQLLREETDADAISRLLEAADMLRLRPPEIPRALPPVGPEDVRLVAWVAVHP